VYWGGFGLAPIWRPKKESGKSLFPKSRQVLKESDNDAVASVYAGYFLDPFDDKSPQDKTTRKEEEEEEVGLEEADEAIWSSCSVGGGCTKS